MGVARSWRTQKSRYRLTGSKCTKCGALYFPINIVCIKCTSLDLEEFQFSGKAKLIEWTRVDEAAKGFEHLVPYYFGIVELEEGVRISTQIVDVVDENILQPGLQLQMTFRKLGEGTEEGIINYGLKAEPVDW